MRAFRDVINPIDETYLSLTGTASRETVRALISLARKMVALAHDLDEPGAKYARARDWGLQQEIADCRAAFDPDALRTRAARLGAIATVAEQPRISAPLVHLMPSLIECFNLIFEIEVTRTWEQCDADGDVVSKPNGPFPLFASALLNEVGLSYAPTTIHSDLGKWITVQKAAKSRV